MLSANKYEFSSVCRGKSLIYLRNTSGPKKAFKVTPLSIFTLMVLNSPIVKYKYVVNDLLDSPSHPLYVVFKIKYFGYNN